MRIDAFSGIKGSGFVARNAVFNQTFPSLPVTNKTVQPVNNNPVQTIDANSSSVTGQKQKKDLSKVKEVLPYVLPLAAIPVTAIITHKISTKNMSVLKNEITALSGEVAGLKEAQAKTAETLKNVVSEQTAKVASDSKNTALLWSAIAGIGGGLIAGKSLENLSDNDKAEIGFNAGKAICEISSDARTARDIALSKSAWACNNLMMKYTKTDKGIQLLTNSDELSKNKLKYDKAIEFISGAASKYLFEAPQKKKITSDHPSVWSVTSEFAPIKEGGLGCVPVDIQNNVTKLGIDIPTFIPMYQSKGLSAFGQQGDNYVYTYKNKQFNLEKAASFKMDSFKDGKSVSNDVEIYVSKDTDELGNEKRLIFVKNDDYFNGTIYQTNEKTEEAEKFAFFSKAVYEFAKAKIDPLSVKDLNIVNKEAYESIKAPDAMILNDWQASPIAALARYKAPMENAYSRLSDDASSKLKDMNIITIGHNAMYQGSTRANNDNMQRYQATSNILNTLFDDFTCDIVEHASSGAVKSNPKDKGLQNIDNVLILNKDDSGANHTNLLNMGICLSDYFHPVSQNYANELVSPKHPELSGELQWALTQKANAGSLVGIINGNDYDVISLESRKNVIKKQTGIDFDMYGHGSDLADVTAARANNKKAFYNEFLLPFSKVNDANPDAKTKDVVSRMPKLEFVQSSNVKALPQLTDEELAQTPVLSSAGRLVSQKGIDVLCDAVKLLYDNWDKDFPGKNKPIFYIAGQDGEGGVQRKYIEALKEKRLNSEDSSRVIFMHGYAPINAISASSDFFVLPSKFEPCGLTQGEAFALATPVIASAVGGIVDTVNRDGKQNAVLTDINEDLSAEGLYQAMKEGIDIFFNDNAKYSSMVKDSLDEDFSWIQKGKKGPIFEYLDKLGIDTDALPDIKRFA